MSPIEDYLDQLLTELRGSARDVRRILAEVEEHLHDAAAEGVAEGLPEDKAQWRAIDRFGPPRVVARKFGRPAAWTAIRALVRAAVPFGAVGMIAVGVSGLVSEVLGDLFGPKLVAGDLPGTGYTPDRCADFREYFPGKSCLDAAAWHHWGEVVTYRAAVGVLGLIVLGGWLLYRRRRPTTDIALPAGLMVAVATALYGTAAAVLLFQGLNSAVIGGANGGSGQWFSAGGVALVAAVAYGLLLIRSLGPATKSTT